MGKLAVDTCYKMKRSTVWSFDNAQHLSMSETAEMKKIADIGLVADACSGAEYADKVVSRR